jgi:hypothetical protein
MPDQHYDLRAYPLFRSVIGRERQAIKSKRCLVVDPSHDADANVRRHADMLWKYVIQPAVLDTEYHAYRTDRNYENGPTDQAAIDAVLDDDLIIAVPSFGNARVFYETALAQAAARPLIILIEEGQDLGFDPRNAEIVTYRLDTESVVSAFNVERLQTVIREIDERGHSVRQGFRAGAAALNGGKEPSVKLFERSPELGYDRRLDMMREATTRIDIMGVANLGLASHAQTLDLVRTCAGRGVEIRVLQCAPTNPALGSLVGARNAEHLDAVKSQINAATGAWKRLADAIGGQLTLTVRRAQTSLPLTSALITDQAILATPYLNSRTTAESPTIFANAGDSYHRTMSQEFDALWADATTAYRLEPSRPRTKERGPEPVKGHARASLFRRDDMAETTLRMRTTNERGFAIIRSVGQG